MRRSTSSPPRAVIFAAVVLVLALSACGPASPLATPTINVTAIYTDAFQTIAAQQATQSATAKPAATPSLTPPPVVPNTGATSAVPATGGTAAASGTQVCDNALYERDVTIPDGTVLAPGQTFVKTWSVLNKGSCAWTPGYKLVFLDGEPMNGSQAPLTTTVSSGDTADLSVNLIAPEIPGNYTGTWRLQNASGAYFGDILTVVITVSGTAAPTQAPAATATP